MNTFRSRSPRLAFGVALILLPVGLLAGCGGGGGGGVGSGGSTPTATPTASTTPTPTSAPVNATGTYNGSWTVTGVAQNGTTLVLSVNPDGTATAVFDLVSDTDGSYAYTATGTVNGANGAVNLTGTFKVDPDTNSNSDATATVVMTGTVKANSSGTIAAGSLNYTFSDGSPAVSGAFTATKTSGTATTFGALKRGSKGVTLGVDRLGRPLTRQIGTR